ncbi:MobA/MobL family protein [uncultured Sphingomonas sp.]|uniref:MobA/MobL family protein n=1 Tax=uncultured Sphingomonas sp. TaxID=158754 RepID=UPI002594F86D|nr:MobA/MobL family protein [uncultured Sphingomonas sp.]
MDAANASDPARPVYAHHVRALEARMKQAEHEAVGKNWLRGGFRDQRAKDSGTARKAPPYGWAVDFFRPSALTGRDRQSGGVRIPHIDFKPITPVRPPRSRDGVVRAHRATQMTAAEHLDYVGKGAAVTIASHLDYISRDTGSADPLGELRLDALDEQAERAEKNALSRYTNIPGGWSAARSLFEAAERTVPDPKTYELITTDYPCTFRLALMLKDAPQWLRPMKERLEAALDEERRTSATDGPIRKRNPIVLDRVTPDVAHERLAWLDFHAGAYEGLFEWRQGRTQRCQYRFVGELPDGLSARQRYDILADFCGQLDKDGWMVAGAIHQPDATNDKRNFHIHIDLYDRKAVWLEPIGDVGKGCWDFERVERRNGKCVHPHRQNKVRYDGGLTTDGKQRKVDVAALMRTRFIDVVNAVVDGVPGIVRYLHGTYKDNNIDLTPLEHMGNRAMAFEKRGLETEIGSRNAQRIFGDEAAACEARVRKDEAALAGENALIRAAVPDDVRALEALERYERLQRRLIRRRLQAELAEVTIAKARSRADAVIQTLTLTPGHRVNLLSGDVELLVEAKRHIAWVEQNSPSPAEREAERRVLARLEHRAAQEWSTIVAATSRAHAGGVEASAPIRYLPRNRGRVAAAPRASRYDPQRRQRLSLWLRKHRGDSDLLTFADGEVRLGKNVPPAIDTLMRHFAGEPSFQRLLSAERHRREVRLMSQAASAKGKLGHPNPSPVSMIPVDQWEWPKRSKRNATAHDAAAIADEPEMDAARGAVNDADAAAALRLSRAIAARDEEKALRATSIIIDAIAKKKLATEKLAAGSVSTGDTLQYDAEPSKRSNDRPDASTTSTATDHSPPQYVHRSKEQYCESRRHPPDETNGVLPGVSGGDVRGGPTIHLPMRDASADRISDAQGNAPISPTRNAPTGSTPRRGLLSQAADVLRGDAQVARPKGRNTDHTNHADPTLFHGKGGHGR